MKKFLTGIITLCVSVSMFSCEIYPEENSDNTGYVSEEANKLNSTEKNILQALYIACKSNQVMGGEYNMAGIYTGAKYNTTIDLSTVKITDISDIYKIKSTGNNVEFCIIEIQFDSLSKNYDDSFNILSDDNKNISYNKKQSTKSFALMLSDGMFSGHTAYLGMVDNDWSMQFLEENSSNLKKVGIKKKFGLYTIDKDKMNSEWIPLCESSGNNSENTKEESISESYQSFIENLDKEYTEEKYIHREYYISDINNDNTPELIYCTATNANDMKYSVYTYYDKQLQYCQTINMGLNVEDTEKLEKISKEAVYVASQEEDTLYLSYCYSKYKYTGAVQMNEDYSLKTSVYYDSGKDNKPSAEYNYPGIILESCDFSDLSLLEKSLDSGENKQTASEDTNNKNTDITTQPETIQTTTTTTTTHL